MNKQNRNLHHKIVTTLLFTMAFLCMFAVIKKFSTSTQPQVKELTDGWVDSAQKAASLKEFHDYENGQSIFFTLQEVPINQTLAFRCRNLFVDIYVDNQLYYSDDKDIASFYGTSPGSRWHDIALPVSKEPVTIEIHGTACFTSSNGVIDNMYLGTPTEITRQIFHRFLFTFEINTLWYMFGITLLLIYCFLHNFYHMDKDFLYLALGTFFCAQWCCVETTMWQYFLGNSEVFHLLGYFSIMVIPIPFGLLGMERLHGIWRHISNVYVAIGSVNLCIMTFLHLSGILEYHYTIVSVHILLLLLVPIAVQLIRSYTKDEHAKKYAPILFTAFGLLLLFIFIGLVKYLSGEYSDFAIYIRISLFSFLVILMMYQIAAINTVMKKGLESELLHDLSLMDHLTKFYNRSGFAEHCEEYEECLHNHKPIGIIQFDVNNLKSVNDNQGHEKGDELICLASSGIYQSFGSYGKCYRMGGDEFLIVLTSDNPEQDYKTGIDNLEVYCGYANSMEDRTYDIKIAHGFTMVDRNETIASAMARADALMYQNKRWMKSQK